MRRCPAICAAGVACLALFCELLTSCGGGGMGGTSQSSATLTQITVTPANQSIANGATLQLTATGIYSDGTQKNLSSSVAWQASPSSIATISGQGDLSTVSQGVAQVSAAYEKVTGTTSVTVGPAALASIAISAPYVTLPLGESEQLTATGSYTDGSSQNLTQSVTWQAAPAAVLTINAQGSLQSLGTGTAQISAEYSGVTGTSSITIGPAALLSLSVSAPKSSLPMGESEQLTATGSFSDGTTQNLTQKVTWEASPTTLAEISSQGSLKGLASGNVQITAVDQTVTATAAVTVGPPVLVTIGVSAPESTLPLGESEQLTATGTFSDGTTQNLTQTAAWVASPSGVAEITAPGDLKGLSTGSAQVSASSQGMSGTAAVTVGAPALLSIAIGLPQPSLPSGESEQLTATGTFSDGSTQNLTSVVSWQATPSNIAAITAQGSLQGLSAGIAQVLASYKSVTGTTSVTIGSAALLRIAVNAPQSSLPLGESEQLTATGTFSDGTSQNLTSVVGWQVSPSNVAVISAQGNLQGSSTGAARVSAAYQGITGTTSVVIAAAALLQISVTVPQASLPLGESEQLTATGTFSDGSTQNVTQSVSWSSSDPTIAAVTSAGVATGDLTGSAVITASAGAVSGLGNLTISAAVIVALNITPEQSSLVIGNTVQLQVTATYSDGTTQNVTSSVTWSSDPPAIAEVNSAGLLTADQVGSASIVAAINGVSGSASLTVTPMLTVSYFSLVNSANSGIDATLQIVNPGFPQGEICAMVYVFDQNQELNECCGCSISDNGLLTLSLVHNLTANPLAGTQPAAGMIAIVPATPAANNQCNAGNPTPNGEILGWQTNVQGSQGMYQMSESPTSAVPLNDTEAQVLAIDCAAVQQLGGSAGTCSCGTGN